MVCKRSSSPEPICLAETPDPLGQTSIDPYSQEPPVDVHTDIINNQSYQRINDGIILDVVFAANNNNK